MKFVTNLVCVLCIVCLIQSCGNISLSSLSKDQKTAMYYLYHRSLLADTFSRLAWDLPVDCRGYDPEEDKLYFIFKRGVGRAKVLNAFTIDTTNVEFAPCESGPCTFGGMQGNIDGYYAFCTSAKNLKVNTKKRFTCNLPHYVFFVNFKELSEAADSSIAYNFPKYFIVPGSSYYHEAATNIGGLISKKDLDPIMKRLAKELTIGLTTNEEKAQKLLDFVSDEIEYSYEDYWYESEVTQRAHEVLMAGEADCSGKSTLYASLLEQCNIPYCLLYYDRHINVGVPGNFTDENKLNYTIDQVKYFMAETTMKGFQIGKSSIVESDVLNKVLYYQFPKKSGVIFNAATHDELQSIDKLTDDE